MHLMPSSGRNCAINLPTVQPHLGISMALVEHQDLPHGVNIVCAESVCLDARCERVVRANWEQGCGLLGAPRWVRKLDERFTILPATEYVKCDGHDWRARRKPLFYVRANVGSKREQRTRNDHLATMAEVLQFQVDHGGVLPKRSDTRQQENKLRKRYDRVKGCGCCGALERMRLQWSQVYASQVGKYLLGRLTSKTSSFRSNAARNYRAIVRHEHDMVKMIEDQYDEGSGTLRSEDLHCLLHEKSFLRGPDHYFHRQS